MVRRDKERRERKLRKQLERQARRLQQSSGRTTANTGTLMEAIKQTIIELRALNAIKEAPQLVGAETLRILLANQVDVMKILRDFRPEMSNRKYHQQLTSQLGFGKSNKNNSFNPFSIENLLAGSKHGVNSLGGQVNNIFGNVSALAGLGVGALSNLNHYTTNGQFSEAFNGMQALNNGAFANAALANAQLNSEHFAKHEHLVKDGYEMSDMDDDDSSSAGSYMSDEMLDVMMDDDLSTMKANEKSPILNDKNDLLVDRQLAIDSKQFDESDNQCLSSKNLVMNLIKKEHELDNRSTGSPDNDTNSNELNSDCSRFKKRKTKSDSRDELNKKLKRSIRSDDEDDKQDEPNENSSKKTNQVQLAANHSAKKRILSELNDTEKLIKSAIKDDSIDNQTNDQSQANEQTEELDKHFTSSSSEST